MPPRYRFKNETKGRQNKKRSLALASSYCKFPSMESGVCAWNTFGAMNEKQKMVMWGAIAAAVLCLLFPVYLGSNALTEIERKQFCNPQYGMTPDEWVGLMDKYRGGELYLDLVQPLPPDIYESENWQDYQKHSPPKLEFSDFGIGPFGTIRTYYPL